MGIEREQLIKDIESVKASATEKKIYRYRCGLQTKNGRSKSYREIGEIMKMSGEGVRLNVLRIQKLIKRMKKSRATPR